jgi:hypothetical protein
MCAFLPRGVRVQTSAELSVLISDVFISVCRRGRELCAHTYTSGGWEKAGDREQKGGEANRAREHTRGL